MKSQRLIVGLLVVVMLLGVATLVSADDPEDKSAIDMPEPVSTPYLQSSGFDPVPIEAGQEFFDPAVAAVTQLELVEDKPSLIPARAA